MMKKNELLILSHLRQNARNSLTKISRRTGLPVSTIFDKLRSYEKSFIRRHTTIIDFQKLGYEIRVAVAVESSRENRDSLIRYLTHHVSVNSVYRINNCCDILIEGIFRNLDELKIFYESLERFHIKTKHEFFILEDIKREAFLSDPELLNIGAG